ncbi:MAG: OPT/YSL family transporter [Gemmataceae bacterium]|nr:OPT/YSL family transporter [Gemmataceae bacterium]
MSSTHITETTPAQPGPPGEPPEGHKPYVPDYADMPEFTWPAVILGAVLGILFGASSLYLLLKVGMTVSASVPIAVLSITLFRFFSRSFGIRRATILENNVVQTTGSAGESIAFGVGVTMPALLLLGFEMEVTRVMVVSLLGGVLGILMMIPLRRAFIVKQHGKLPYPEGTACAEVLVAGEKGGATARMVFIGFGIAAVHKFFTRAFRLWSDEPSQHLYTQDQSGTKSGLKGGEIGGELAPEMLGVGFLIGPRIASLMLGGAILSYFVLGPLIATLGEDLNRPMSPATSKPTPTTAVRTVAADPTKQVFGGERAGDALSFVRAGGVVAAAGQPGVGPLMAAPLALTRLEDKGLIRNMDPGGIKAYYLRYIGAGAVAAGGIIGMLKAMPLIIGSILSGLRDLRASRAAGREVTPRTERDMPMTTVIFGSLGLVLFLMFVPALGLGLSLWGLLGAVMILLFGFLFVTVSSRLTGEVGSSSNPISGMTIATLLMTCLIFLALGRTVANDPSVLLTALMIAAVVCIASSNGGTTSQDLKTGYLVGATPYKQQWGILVGALTSAVVIGVTMLLLNAAGTHYTTRGLPQVLLNVPADAPREQVGRPHDEKDTNTYRVVHVRQEEAEAYKDKGYDVPAGRYLVDEQGRPKYKTDIPIARESEKMDTGQEAPKGFSAPQPALFALLTRGILGGTLEWSLVVVGVLIALVLELAGVSSLPFAVGMYLPLSTSTPIFVGGMLRWGADRARGVSASESETETSPGVLLSSGYIAGGSLVGLILALFAFLPDAFNAALNLGQHLGPAYNASDSPYPKMVALLMFAVLAVILYRVGSQRSPEAPAEPPR